MTAPIPDETSVREAAATLDRLQDHIGQAVIGRSVSVELLTVALLCGGHILLEDVPGTGKTLLAKAFARSLGLSFRRIQFTPDLLPSDITGSQIFDQRAGDFSFRPGPVFAHVVLADEINRATPRVQSALLEAMEERQVTVDGVTRPLDRPFIVLATENPVEFEGTFPLPEAQLDRFLMRVSQGYPGAAEEDAILRQAGGNAALDRLVPLLTVDDIGSLGTTAERVHVADDVRRYLLAFVRRTREHPQIGLGASPRAGLALLRAAQALACLRGRAYVTPDDIKELARPVLEHRMVISAEARLKARDTGALIDEMLAAIAVPVEDPVRMVPRHA